MNWLSQFFGLNGIIASFNRTIRKLDKFENREIQKIERKTQETRNLTNEIGEHRLNRARASKIRQNLTQLVAGS